MFNKDKPVEISTLRDKDEAVFFFKNGILENPQAAESNGIGLKTCKRLCRFIAGDFGYDSDGETFTVRLSLKLGSKNSKKTKNNKVLSDD